jgi:hypothetical protein
MMCISLAGEEFLEAINTSRYIKDAGYIAEVIKRYLIKVGSQNVFQICKDNASMLHKAISIVQEDWPHLYSTLQEVLQPYFKF